MARKNDTVAADGPIGRLSGTAEAAVRAALENRPGPFSAEEQARRAQIALPADPDDPEDGDVTVGALEDALAQRRARLRGRQVAPTKKPVTLRLDGEIVDYFRGSGRGWQTRLNALLRDAVRDALTRQPVGTAADNHEE